VFLDEQVSTGVSAWFGCEGVHLVTSTERGETGIHGTDKSLFVLKPQKKGAEKINFSAFTKKFEHNAVFTRVPHGITNRSQRGLTSKSAGFRCISCDMVLSEIC
jgi:hypothetical protein